MIKISLPKLINFNPSTDALFKRLNRLSVLLLLIAGLTSCAGKKETQQQLHIANYDTDVIFMDYDNAMLEGFAIPSASQTGSGYFTFNFQITNQTSRKTRYYYKLYYQNESYKFEEVNSDGNYNELSAENFYGSYENVETGFRTTSELLPDEMIALTDSIRIVGNPRSEEKYFGNPGRYFGPVSKEQIERKVKEIRNNKDWYEMIVKKAENRGVDVETQLVLDAEYIIDYSRRQGKENNRWKRNPRVGDYTFLLVMVPENSWQQIPDYIKHINLKNDDQFINPFFYFRYGEGASLDHIAFAETPALLHVKNQLPVTSGVWIPSANIYGEAFDTSYYSGLLNNSEKLFNKAAFKLYENYRSREDSIYNVPVVADFFGKGYTLEEFEKNAQIPKSERIPIVMENTKAPGKNIKVDTTDQCIRISNPGCTLKDPAKVNAGVITRHGFTYGKITVKVKFTQLLNRSQVWNGITDAFWLITENMESWNARRICKKEGYMPFYGAGEGEQRVPQISYTEVDFEIVKAAETWPSFCYPDRQERVEPASNFDKVMVTCTNWDMACKQPENFGVGVHEIHHEGKTYYGHRWDEYYNAVTQKVPEKDDELFKTDYYYFQIEWKPTEIFWRIGPEKDQLRLIGYINDTYTSIPNNQMLIIFTQEYHYSHWWPKSPFKQEDVPFPAKDMEGIIYEVTIE